MKKLFFISMLLTIVLSLCSLTCTSTPTFHDPYVPMKMTRSELEQSVAALPIEPVRKAGKIYIRGNVMFLTDVNKGFHVFDYSDPINPVKTGFLKIPGATDLSVRDNTIYINQAVDLITIDYNFSNHSLAVLHRNRNVFPPKVSPNGTEAPNTPQLITVDWFLP